MATLYSDGYRLTGIVLMIFISSSMRFVLCHSYLVCFWSIVYVQHCSLSSSVWLSLICFIDTGLAVVFSLSPVWEL